MKNKKHINTTIIEKASIVFFSVLFCIVILEVGLRYIGEKPTNTASGYLEQNGDSYRLKRNAIKNINWPSFSYTVYTNAYGFRDKTIGDIKIDDKGYFVFIGASEVFGNGVNYEDSFVGMVDEYSLKTYGKKVLNLAIGGHYFIDQEMLLKEFILRTQKKPEIVFFCVNALHIPKFDKRNDKVRVINGDLFNKEKWRMAFIRLVLGNTSSAYCFFRNSIRKIQTKYFDWEPVDKSHDFLNIYSITNRMRDSKNVVIFYNYLDSFNTYCRLNQIKPVYIYTPITDSYRLLEFVSSLGGNPANYDASYYTTIMTEYCKKNNLDFINLRPVLQEYYDKGKKLRFKLDPHYNEFSNKIIGEYLINKIFK